MLQSGLFNCKVSFVLGSTYAPIICICPLLFFGLLDAKVKVVRNNCHIYIMALQHQWTCKHICNTRPHHTHKQDLIHYIIHCSLEKLLTMLVGRFRLRIVRSRSALSQCVDVRSWRTKKEGVKLSNGNRCFSFLFGLWGAGARKTTTRVEPLPFLNTFVVGRYMWRILCISSGPNACGSC